MQIVCPRCGVAVAGDSIDVAHGRAVCKPCGELFALPDFGRGPGGELAVMPATELAPPLAVEEALSGPRTAFRPATLNWHETQLAGRQEFSLAPRRLLALPLLGFAGVWNAFLFFWYSIALSGHGGPSNVMLWFPLLHVAAGVFITYLGLTKLFNRARFSIDRERVSFRVGPIPQRGGRVDEPTANVRGFDVWKNESAARNNTRGFAVTYQVRLLTEDRRSITLPFDAADAEQAAWIATRLNGALDELRAPHSYRD